MAVKNLNLHAARQAKNDEFYTQLPDIENELRHYRDHFRGKAVLCNCDDPRISNFFYYFAMNFERLGLKRLITTCYKNQNPDLFSAHKSETAVYLIYDGDKNDNRVPDPAEIGIKPLKGDGDFRSPEGIELLKQSDIVVTNPPFSLFREYVAQLIEYGKQFLIIGSQNAITYKEIFTLIKENKIWLGHGFAGGNAYFKVSASDNNYVAGVYDPQTGLVKFRNVRWFTNLDHAKRHEDLILYKNYTPEEYPKYDNYDAIEVSKTADIPMDYDGVMGVPITFLDKYNPEQFELVGSNRGIDQDPNGVYGRGSYLNGKETFKRLFIKRIK
ncbi:MAG: putative adenine-specific methylase [Bacteroidales bacterium]